MNSELSLWTIIVRGSEKRWTEWRLLFEGVSILMLEIALIDTFGDIHSSWARFMMTLSGAGAWLLAAAVGALGIRWYMKNSM